MAKKIVGGLYAVHIDSGIHYVETEPGEPLPIRDLAEYCADLAHCGTPILGVSCLKEAGANGGDKTDLDIINTEEYKEALERIRAEELARPKSPAETVEEIIARAEQLGWCASKDEDGIEFNQGSPAGEDFFFYAYGTDASTLALDIQRAYMDFDCDDHVKHIMLGTGAPDLETLVKDAKCIEKMLMHLSDAIYGI